MKVHHNKGKEFSALRASCHNLEHRNDFGGMFGPCPARVGEGPPNHSRVSIGIGRGAQSLESLR